MAFSMLFSSYTIVNIKGDLVEESKIELFRINSLIESLKVNECFESDEQLSDQLPSLIWVSREQECEEAEIYNEISSWKNLESILNLDSCDEDSSSLTKLEYIQNKDYCRLPDHSSSTPFCEGIQDIRRKVSNSVNPIRLGGYCVNGRMYWDMISILTEHINSGALPNYHQMFDSIIDKEISLNIEEAKEIFESEFVQKLHDGAEDCKIDERYHVVANHIMKTFKRQLDPDLNVEDEITHVFNGFVQKYNIIKQDNKLLNENLDYSESIDGSEIMDDLEVKEEISNDDEFNINLLNSEYDQPAPEYQLIKPKAESSLTQVVIKLKEELKEK